MVVVWIAAMLFWHMIQFSPDSNGEGITEYIDLIVIIIVGVLFGINFLMMNWIFNSQKASLDRLSYGGIIFLYSLMHLVSYFITLLISLMLIAGVFGEAVEYLNFVLSINMLKVYLYTSVVSIAIFLIRIVNQKFGPGVLKDLILGKYRNPKEKKQIFLFMDLKSSTSYAEKLGHVKYSNLIQECFADLTPAAVQNRARIYQYVGDEVVLTWPYEEGIESSRCVKAFYQFKQIIQEKSQYYMATYGLVPEFKAGLNGGVLMAAEVGLIKRSVAYHGDVINTASRLQHLCRELKQELLISDSVVNDLPEELSLQYHFIEYRKLKGKRNAVGIFSPLYVN